MDKDKMPPSRSKVKSVTAKVDPANLPKKKDVAKAPTPAASSKPSSNRPSSSRPKSGSSPPSSRPKSGTKTPSKPEGEKQPAAPKRPLPKKDGVAIAKLKQDALRGKTDREYPLTSKIVRIFTSSTFTDTKVERNTLMEKVYPKLKVYCQEQGYEFQVVDMRWGVRDEATDDHMTSELCMREIKDCQTYSTGPSFITFLAQKYGYRPFPPKIDAAEFDKLLKAVRKADDKKLLTDWFVKDENCVPAQYQLQPIREKLEYYANDAQPEKKKQAQDKWWEVFGKMQLILRDAATQNLEAERVAHKYFWSVTEEEIENGVLNYDNAKKGCFWFRRDITDLKDNVKSKMAPRFMDITGGVDKAALDLLTKLKEKKMPQHLPAANVMKYEVKWTENGIDVEKSKEHRQYIDKFSGDFERVLKGMIEEGIHERYKTEVDDLLYQESVQHVVFGQNKAKLFCGRQEFLDRVKGMITEKNNRKPTVICGEAGSGKTTFMAKVFQMIPEWLEKGHDVPVVVRFVGTTVESGTTKDLLFSLCHQIHRLTGKKGDIPEDLNKLKDYFKGLIQNLKKPLCILLDSLDQLKDAGKGLREWVPTSLPDGVRLIMSSIPGDEFRVVPRLRRFLPDESFVEVPVLTKDEVKTIVQAMFEKSERTLQSAQMEQLISACEKCPLPLYTKIAFDEACRWKSHQKVDKNALGATVTVLINSLFDRVEKYHGKVLVSRALGYITAARAGLSLGEIEDVLSIDDVALNDIYQYHMPPLRRLPPLLWVRIQADLKDYLVSTGAGGVQVIRWYHRQFNTVATERYLADDDTRIARHATLAELFLGKWSNGEKKPYRDKQGKQSEADRHVTPQPLVFKEASRGEGKTQFNLRKMNELCYHLIQSKQIAVAKERCLCDFEWIYEKLRALGIFAILEDYKLANEATLEDKETRTVEDILELAKNGLAHDHKQLPCHLLGRLYSLKDWEELPYIKKLVAKTNKPHFDCLIPTVPFLEAGGGPYLRRYVGHEAGVLSFGVNKDGSKLVSCGTRDSIIVWDMETAEILNTFNTNQSYKLSDMVFCNGDKFAAVVEAAKLFVIDLETGQIVHKISISEDPYEGVQMGHCHVNETGNIMYGCTASRMIAHDVKSGKEIFTIKRLSKVVEDPFESRRPYIGGLGPNVAYHFPGDNKVNFINETDYANTKNVLTKELFSTKDMKPEHSFVRMTTTSTGVLVCYIFDPPRTTEPGFELKDAFAHIKTFDIKTGKELKTFKKLPAGMLAGNSCADALMATGPHTVVFSAYMYGKFHFKEYDINSGDSRDTLILEILGIAFVAKAGKDRILVSTFDDYNNIMLVDLSTCRKTTDASLTDTAKKPRTFGLSIHGPLLDSKRYLDYDTIERGLGVWDLARNACVRYGHADEHDLGSAACWVSPTTVVLAGMENHYYDYKEDKFLGAMERYVGVYDTDHYHKLFVAIPGQQKIMVVGPEVYQVSTYDLKKGAIESTMTGPKTKTYRGLMASDNFEILIAIDSNQGSGGDHVLSIFDLKTKKPLEGIKYKSTTAISQFYTHSMYMTKDGKYLSAVLDGVPHVWNIRLGKAKTYQYDKMEGEDDQDRRMFMVRFVETSGELITGYRSGKLRKFDLKSTKCTMTIDTKMKDVRAIEVSADGRLAACTPTFHQSLSLIDIKRGNILMTLMVGKKIHSYVFSTNDRFLVLAINGVDAVLPLYIYHKDKHRNDPENPTPESKARKELLSDPDTFGEPRNLNAKPAAPNKKKDGPPKKKKT